METQREEVETEVDRGLIAFVEMITMWVISIGFITFIGIVGTFFYNYIKVMITGI